ERTQTSFLTFKLSNVPTEAVVEFGFGEAGDAEALVAGFLSGEQLDLCSFDTEEIGEEVAAGAVGGALDRRRREANGQDPFPPAHDLVAGGARLETDLQLHAHPRRTWR